MSQAKTSSKKQQFTDKKGGRLPQVSLFACIVAAAVLLLSAGYAYRVFSGSDGREQSNPAFGEPVATPRSYIGKRVFMTDIEPTVEDGKIKLPLSVVDENNIVYFEMQNNEGALVPIMAYITPSGRLFAGSSLCEPCRGQRFSLAGETLVCDVCGTTYTIENHRFISGAAVCGQYPPANLEPVVQEGEVIIDLNNVLNWRSRV